MTSGSILLQKGRYRARFAASAADIETARRLRTRAFRTTGPDRDDFDRICDHVLIEDIASGAAVGCFRMMLFRAGTEIGTSYSAGFYDLSALQGVQGRLLELGRFCIDPDRLDADILRLSWGAITRIVDRNGVGVMFGCSSFRGVDPRPYQEALAWIGAHHLAPDRWAPGRKAKTVVSLTGLGRPAASGRALAMRHIPALLRTYLGMGGWVSDHAVVDEAMNTLHVFTAVEVARIPRTRQRLLRAVAAD